MKSLNRFIVLALPVLFFPEIGHAIQFEPVDLSVWIPITSDRTVTSGQVINNAYQFSVTNPDRVDGDFTDLISPVSDVTGILATFNISSSTGDRFVNAGLIQRVGKVGDNFLEAQVSVTRRGTGGPSHDVDFLLRFRSPNDGDSDLPNPGVSFGNFGRCCDDGKGNGSAPEWEIGQNVTIALTRFDNATTSEIWFYMEGQPGIAKYEWLQPSNPPLIPGDSGDDFTPAVFAFGVGGTAENAISGTASNVFLIRP